MMKNYFLLVLIIFPFLFLNTLFGKTIYTIDECIEIALKKKSSVKIAALRVESSRAEVKGSLSNILPTLSYSSGFLNQGSYYDRQFSSPIEGRQYYSSTFSLSQPIFDGGRWRNSIVQMKNRYTSSKRSYSETVVEIALNIKKAFYQYLKDKELLEVTRQAVELAEQQFEFVRHQFEIEAVARTDLLKQQVQLGNMKVDFINQKVQVKNSFNQLAYIMGLDIRSEFDVIDDGSSVSNERAAKNLWQDMKNNNQSLLSQKLNIESAGISYRLSKSSLFPTISALFSYDGSSDKLDDLYSNFNEDWRYSAQVSVSYPLFSGFERSSEIEKAKLEVQIQKEDYDDLEKNLRVQLDAIVEQLDNLKKKVPIYKSNKISADEDLRLARERYNLGAATILDVLDAQLSGARANSSLVQAVYDEKIWMAELDALLGKY